MPRHNILAFSLLFRGNDKHSWTISNLYRACSLIRLMIGQNGLWANGGLMDVWRENKHPRYIVEKRFVRLIFEYDSLQFFDLCFDHKSLIVNKFEKSSCSMKILPQLCRPNSSLTQIQDVLDAGANWRIYCKNKVHHTFVPSAEASVEITLPTSRITVKRSA